MHAFINQLIKCSSKLGLLIECPHKLLTLKAHYTSTKMKVAASAGDSIPLSFDPEFDKDVLSPHSFF